MDFLLHVLVEESRIIIGLIGSLQRPEEMGEEVVRTEFSKVPLSEQPLEKSFFLADVFLILPKQGFFYSFSFFHP